jgi:hypothetical protein
VLWLAILLTVLLSFGRVRHALGRLLARGEAKP